MGHEADAEALVCSESYTFKARKVTLSRPTCQLRDRNGMDKEKMAFARRLKAALQDAGIEASGTRIEELFAARSPAHSVTSQGANGWLRGQYMPTPDKIRVLADIVGVDPSTLAFGEAKGRRVSEARREWKIPAADRAAIDAFLGLPASQRKLVGALLAELAAVKLSR